MLSGNQRFTNNYYTMKNLQWQRDGDLFLLKNNQDVLVSLSQKNCMNADFVMGTTEYQIERKGFWIPGYSVSTKAGDHILKLTHSFWGSRGTIAFNDGWVCDMVYSSKGGLTLRFTEGGNEILVYGTVFENKAQKMYFNTGTALLDADKLLMLAALGLTIFNTMQKENNGEDDGGAIVLLSGI